MRSSKVNGSSSCETMPTPRRGFRHLPLEDSDTTGCPGREVDGSMVSKWVISPTYKWGIPWGYNPLILTFDTNFLGHPSSVESPWRKEKNKATA